ncbi:MULTISPECIES: MFS transporter [unclassified Bradyrhizobium]|uniref:MFS transporter n=1 Tax=unclassified Bradyrhizobium TaxID=2631580 RepID=UPI0028E449A0|nr:MULTISPECIES: MFS transporter [unclassified Bradyrhizobium]
MQRILIDITPIRKSAPFRRLWVSSLISGLGGQMSVFAVAFQVFNVSGSSLAVGAVGLFVAIPSIGFAMFGGTLADAVDRRKLMIFVSLGQLFVASGLCVQAAVGLEKLWIIYALVGAQATLGAFIVPARRAFLRRLLSADEMPAALALNLFSMHGAQIVGPALGGFAVAALGLKVCFMVQMLGFFASFLAALSLPTVPPDEAAPRIGIAAVVEALKFLWQTPILRGAFLADLSMTVMGTPMALFPAINSERFGGLPETLGLFTTAIALGGVVGTLCSGLVTGVANKGRALLFICALWGVLIVMFGVSANLWIALTFLALAGAVDSLAVTLGQTIVQNSTPDALRGRASAAEHMVMMGGPQLGGARAGLIGSWAGATLGIVAGGLTTVGIVAIIFLTVPSLAEQADNNG